MAANSREALTDLLESLQRNDASSVADEITRIVARGTTEEVELHGKVKELSQRPLEPDEAYRLAVEIFVASLEPMVMKRYALKELEKTVGHEPAIEWRQDFVEESPIGPGSYQEVSIPSVGNVEKLEEDLKKLVELLGDE